MFTAVTTFFSGMISSFIGAHGPSTPLSFTILAPNGQLIQAPKGLFFDFIAGYLIGIDTPLGRRWPHIFSDVYLRTPNSGSHKINFSLLPSNTFTGNMQGSHVDFSNHGLEFILTVILVYVNRLKGIDLFASAPIIVAERREMIDDIHFNTQDFLNHAWNWAYFNGYLDDGNVALGHSMQQVYMMAFIDYGLTLIEADDQFTEMLTMALNEDGLLYGSGGINYSGNISFNQQGQTQVSPISTNSNTGLVDTHNTLSSLNLSKFGLGALILIIFLTFKK